MIYVIQIERLCGKNWEQELNFYYKLPEIPIDNKTRRNAMLIDSVSYNIAKGKYSLEILINN